jgi:hypothetical protein
LKNDLKLKEKLKKYFFKYNYKQIEDLKNQFSFVRKWSLLDGFILNILNCETKINIEIVENKKEQLTTAFIPYYHFSLFKKSINSIDICVLCKPCRARLVAMIKL